MKSVHKSTTQTFVFPGSECGSDQTGIPQVLDHVLARETGWHHCSRIAGLHFKIGDEQDKLECRIDIESRDRVGCLGDNCKATEKSCCGIVRMTLQFRTKGANILFRKTTLGDSVQRHQDPESDRDAAAKPPCLRDIALN